MHAISKNSSECKYYLRLDLIRAVKAMLLTVAFITIVNILALFTSPIVSTKSTPCFTDGDCPSAMEKCVYGSWKGLGNCHRKGRDAASGIRRLVRSNAKAHFRNRRLVRRKRNPSNIWNDSYLSQKRWDPWPKAKQQSKSVHPDTNDFQRNQKSNERFAEIAADLYKFGRSYIIVDNVNYTVTALPASDGDSDWLITIAKDDYDPREDNKASQVLEEPRKNTNDELIGNHARAFEDDRSNTASILLENSFGSSSSSGGDAVVNISVRYPVPMSSDRRYRTGSDIRLRFRRQLPGRIAELGEIDPLINKFKHVEPVIPSAENAFGKIIDKRSAHSEKEMQRIRRELEEIEDDVAPLPKILRSSEEGPVIIEDMFNGNVRTSTLRKRSHSVTDKANKAAVSHLSRPKRHHKAKHTERSSTKNGWARVLDRSPKRHKRRLSRAMSQLIPSKKSQSNLSVKTPRNTLRQRVKKNTVRRSARRGQTTGNKMTRKVVSKFAKDAKRSNEGALGTGAIGPVTTDAPDPFASLRNTKEPHIDYYDVSKRNSFKGEDDEDSDPSADDDDPEAFLDDDDDDDDDNDNEEIEVVEESTRKKRQTLAEELEDDDDQQDIPSWRETVELLRRANTFAVPAHDSTGHVILVRKVRDLGALDLGESLAKLKETMAKIFGRCSPARRRKRSHPSPPEVVKDQLSNEETWEIQGEGNEVVDQAKIDVHMDDDKPYNVTTVLRPMGKRSYENDQKTRREYALRQAKARSGISRQGREMRDVLEQNAKLDAIPHHKVAQRNTAELGLRNDEHISQTGRSRYSKRNDEYIPLNKDVHMEAQEGEPVEIDLTVDEEPGGGPPVAEVQSNTLSVDSPQAAVTKRDRHQPSAAARSGIAPKTGGPSSRVMSRNPSHSVRGSQFGPRNDAFKGANMNMVRRGPHAKCLGCKSLHQAVPSRAFNKLNSGKAVREPYIITRRYNDSKVRRARADGIAGAGTREASDEASLDRANLLYLADGDPLPSSWRAPVANSKRDVDVEIEVEETDNSTSTTPQDKSTTTTTTTTTESPPVTIKVKIEKEKDEDVFNDNPNTKSTKSPTSIEASASITAERRMPSPRRSSSVVLDSEVFSETPARTRVLSLSPARPSSVLTVASGDGRPSVEETITSGGGSDSWGISGSSDRLMALISSIEKALRVPLGGSDGDVDQFTVVDDSSDAVQTTRVISSQPDITEQKTNYIYSVNDPQPPLVVATATQEKKPDMVKMDITTGTGQVTSNVGDLNENIYLKGFELPRKPPKPLFVDGAAKKMIYVEPTYKTVVSSGIPKYKYPLSYARLYNGPITRIRPADQWTQITNIKSTDSDTVELGDSKQVTVEKFAEQPSGAEITDIRASKTTELIQPPPTLLGVQRNIVMSGQVIDSPPPPPPETDRDTTVKVVSSVSSEDQNSRKNNLLKSSPTITVHMDGQEDGMNAVGNKGLPPNIRIFHNGRDSDGKIIAAIGSQSNIKKKKDLQEIEDLSSMSAEDSILFESSGFVPSANNQNSAQMKVHGSKRSAPHTYRVPNTRGAQMKKRKVNSRGVPVATKRADAGAAQPAPVVHTYSKDPGVQGATMNMLTDLASQLSTKNAQKRKTPALTRRRVACAGRGNNCRETRQITRDTAPKRNAADEHSNLQLQSELGDAQTKHIRKRDVSRSVFEQPKVFIVSPNTIVEAPGTKYKFMDPLERGNVTDKLKVYTISDIDAKTIKKITAEKLSSSDDSSSDDDEEYDHEIAANLPMSHEKALQETEGKERFKIMDSSEGFSVHAPSFDKKITSGGQISEDTMVPIPVDINRNNFPKDENRLTITTDIEPHKDNPGLKISTIETADKSSGSDSEQKTKTIEYVDAPEEGTATDVDAGEVVEVIESHSAPLNTRQKRRSSNSAAGSRSSREDKIQTLRTELQNLNSIGSKLGLNFFDKSSIDRIVREVSSEGREEEPSRVKKLKSGISVISPKYKRKLKTHQSVNHHDLEKSHTRAASRGRIREKDIKGARRSSAPYKTIVKQTLPGHTEARNTGSYVSKAKQKRRHHRSISSPSQEMITHERDDRRAPSKRTMRSSEDFVEEIEVDADDKSIEVAPRYHYNNKIRNNRPLVISNPERYDLSNSREREEKLKVSNQDSEPLDLTAVLRGRRRRRDIEPDELFRISPLITRAVRSRAAPGNSAPAGQWQRQVAPVSRFQRERGEGVRSDFDIPVAQSPLFAGSNQRRSSIQDMFNYPRAAAARRQQPVVRNSPQRLSNSEIDKRQQIMRAFSSQRNVGPQPRQINRDLSNVVKSSDDKNIAGSQKGSLLYNNLAKKSISQDPMKSIRTERNGPKEAPAKGSNATKQETTAPAPKTKSPDMGVWKKLGEIFDIGPKETARPEPETTTLPTSSPPPAPPAPPPPAAGRGPVVLPPLFEGQPDERDGPRKPPIPSPRPPASEERARSGLRAAIVDRLLQDLRKMASARGSEMARAESDLIEILHDYQTDLMDEDEKTIAGMPFQGVRIHDNVAIPVVYQAVPIKLEGLSQHRLVVRSSDPGSARDLHNSWDDAPYNPP